MKNAGSFDGDLTLPHPCPLPKEREKSFQHLWKFIRLDLPRYRPNNFKTCAGKILSWGRGFR
jgi:hypothetical protein